jgi:hypothetical protein
MSNLEQSRRHGDEPALAVVRCVWDDTPIKMYSTADAAIEWAETTDPNSWDRDLSTLKWPKTQPVGISVIVFDENGRPKEIYKRDFEEDEIDEFWEGLPQRDYRVDLRDIALDVRSIAAMINDVDDGAWPEAVVNDLGAAIERLTEIKGELEQV